MIVARAPLRVSLLGGGSDYPEHFREHGGYCLGMAINKYTYVTTSRLARLFDYSIRVSYSKTELVSGPNEVDHPAVREGLKYLGIDAEIEINCISDLPARCGLGSSSSFAIALLQALHVFKGEIVDQRQLAEEAVVLERELIRDHVGVQDQFICALGGVIALRLSADGVHPSTIPLSRSRSNELQDHLLLFYTGIRRRSHNVLEQQIQRTRAGRITQELIELADLAREGEGVLARGSIMQMGALLDQAWKIKRSLSSSVTNEIVDGAYERAMKAGALGGKLLGAGAGGFLLVFADPERHQSIEAALSHMPRVDFDVDYGGANVAFYSPD